MEISARNRLKGIIKMIKRGSVNTEVRIVISGGDEIVSIITTHSVENMGLQEGMEVYALINASEVLIGIDQILAARTMS